MNPVFVLVSQMQKNKKINHVASNLRKRWLLNILGTCPHLSATRLSIFNSTIQPQQPRIPLEIQEGHGLITFMQNFSNSLCTSFLFILPSSSQWVAKGFFLTPTQMLWYFIWIPCSLSAPLSVYMFIFLFKQAVMLNHLALLSGLKVVFILSVKPLAFNSAL